MTMLDDYLTPEQPLDWFKTSLNIIKRNEEMTDEDIRRTMRWIEECAHDTIYIDGDKARLGRHGIGLMLSVTLIEFLEYYMWLE